MDIFREPLSPESQAFFDSLADPEVASAVFGDVEDENQILLNLIEQAAFTPQIQSDLRAIPADNDIESALSDFNPRISWIPPPGTGALVRNETQFGGGLGDEQPAPIIEFQELYRLPDKGAWGNFLVESTVCVRFKHNLKDLTDIMNAAPAIDKEFERIVSPLLDEAQSADYISFVIEHPALDEPIRIAFVQKQNFDPRCFMNAIFRFVQSNDTRFLNDNELVIRAQILRLAEGSHYKKLKAVGKVGSWYDDKRSVIKIRSTTNKCGWLAITLAKIYADNPKIESKTQNYWRNLKRPNSKQLSDEMTNLFSGQICIKEALNASDFGRVERMLGRSYQFIVIQRPSFSQDILCPQAPLHIGSADHGAKQIIIEFTDKHYNMVKGLEAYFSCKHFCIPCWKGVDKRFHTCRSTCRMCNAIPPCKDDGLEHQCEGCFMLLPNNKCLQMHDCGKKYKKCPECEIVYNVNVKPGHFCDVYRCQYCSELYTETPHRCMLRPLRHKKLQQDDDVAKVIVVFDIESRLIPQDGGVYQHSANLLICRIVCDECCPTAESVKSDECQFCGPIKKEYFGDDCVKDFVSFITEELSPRVDKMSGSQSRIHVFSHNGKGYDHRFIMQELFKRDFKDMRPVMQGSKVLKIDIANVRFQDSLSLLPMPLSDIPKAMGCQGYSLKKGFFPHLFNKEENYDLIDAAWPAIEFYDIESLREKNRKELLTWYDTVKDKPFNFKEELFSYCDMDVKVLLYGIRKFRELFKSVTKLDPITRCFTLAGIAFEQYRACHLPDNAIGITPLTGYLESRNASAEGNAWLDLIEVQNKFIIEREKHIGPYWADGFYDGVVYEYFGCFYHGCQKCYAPDTKCAHGRPAVDLHNKTIEKIRYFERRGYKVKYVWACDKDVKEDHFMKARIDYWKTLKNEDDSKHLGPKQALAGGRTENFKLLHDCQEDEELKYLDVCSMYPFVLKNNDFPIGHADLITHNVNYEPGKYFGFVKARVLPPEQLHKPILPYRTDDKLLFPLCKACADELNQGSCKHSDDERALDGEFVSVELDLALSKGYKILDVSYVIHYNERNATLFASFIKQWLKLKIEKSGFPKGVETEEQILAFIKETKEREGIDLDRNEIEFNPGLRMISKLMLNSLWGRLAMKGNMWQTDIVSNYQKMVEIVSDEKKEVVAPVILDRENSVLVTWRFKDEKDARQAKTSPAIAAFVTAYGRMKLYNVIDQVESVRTGRSLYCDTDSLIFTHKIGDPEVVTGSLLGDLTDEAAGKKIKRGVFLAPKTYFYTTIDSDGKEATIIKAKGITMNTAACAIVNQESMAKLAEQFLSHRVTEPLMVPQTQFFADKRRQEMKSRNFLKRLQVTSTKRRIVGIDTVPFGYKD